MIFRLLIVDDEATMRKGIANYMNWDSIGCSVAGTAADGLDAIDFLKENPVDIVITDIKMPAADGLEVARYIYENHPETKVIILTGYAEFEYAQAAIQYNVSSFLLKPTNKKDLFEAVQSAQKQSIVSKSRTSVAKEETAFLMEQLLLDLTNLPFSQPLEQRLSELGIVLDHYYVAAFQMIPLETDITSLKNIIINEKKKAYCYQFNNLVITVYFLDKKPFMLPDYITENCREISDIMYNLDSRKVAVGISGYHESASAFSPAVSEAIHALSQNFYSEDNLALFSASSSLKEFDLSAGSSLTLFQLESLLHDRLFEEAELLLNKIFTEFKSNFVNAWETKNICFQIYYICSRLLIKREIPAPSGQYLSRINCAPDIFVLKTAVLELISHTQELLTGSANIPNKLIENTIRYIHCNLSAPLSLDSISESLHISPSHLSRTFKKTCDESLTEFINRTRIEKAKDYLLQSDILTYEIAEQVGYNDAAYFSSIFKKYTGVSPTDYRSINRKNSL